MTFRALVVALMCFAAPTAVAAQEATAPAVAAQVRVGPRGDRLTGAQAGPVDIIMPHISDSHSIDLPYWG
ncbi:MAG: hypothetical protein ACRENC_11055, partial [Gemmatimonadaceae bacterium]